MAGKKKARKKKSSTTTARKNSRVKKMAAKRNPAKKLTQKKSKKQVVAKKKFTGKSASANTSNASRQRVRRKNQTADSAFTGTRRARALSGEQSGDLQGLSRSEGPDSESVEELLEEGNPFEAAAVAGVEEADNSEGREVHTHEVPEDDVPEEYLDNE